MSEAVETAILAGGCFWGMQDLIRKRPGRAGHTGRLHRRRRPNATYRNHGTHAEAIEITFDPESRPIATCSSSSSRSTTRRPSTVRGTRRRATLGDLLSRRRAARVAEDTIADVEASGSGQGKVVTEIARPDRSGKRNPSIRTIWSGIRMATRATSLGLAGCFLVGRTRSPAEQDEAGPAAHPGARARVSRAACVRRASTRCAQQAESFDCTRELCSRSGGPDRRGERYCGATRAAGAPSWTSGRVGGDPLREQLEDLAAGLGVRAGRIAEDAVRALRLDALQERLHLRAADVLGPVELIVAATRSSLIHPHEVEDEPSSISEVSA